MKKNINYVFLLFFCYNSFELKQMKQNYNIYIKKCIQPYYSILHNLYFNEMRKIDDFIRNHIKKNKNKIYLLCLNISTT